MIDKSELYVLQFHASWCGPCQRMKDSFKSQVVLDELKNYGNAKFLEKQEKPLNAILVDVDENKKEAENFFASSIPLVVIVDRKRNVYKRLSGYTNPDALAKWLKNPCYNKDCSPIHQYSETSFINE